MDFERKVHPYYRVQGEVRALDTIKNSITTHRGCYGECNFCSIAVHQGRTVVERSEASIIAEAENIVQEKGFKGYISDLGGPTANMYGIECGKKLQKGACQDKRCLYPQPCPALRVNHKKQLKLLKSIKNIKGIV